MDIRTGNFLIDDNKDKNLMVVRFRGVVIVISGSIHSESIEISAYRRAEYNSEPDAHPIGQLQLSRELIYRE